MEILKLTHVIEEDPDYGCPAYLIFKYRGMYFMAWKDLDSGEPYCWVENPNEISMVYPIGSIETRFPGGLRLANGSDYSKYEDLISYVQEKVFANDKAIKRFVELNKVEEEPEKEDIIF